MNAHEIVSKIRTTRLLKQDWNTLVQLLDKCSLSEPDENGVYPLHEICTGAFPMVNFAVERGADVNMLHREGYTPLAISVARDDEANVADLLKLGARVDILDHLENTPLLSAIIRGSKGYKVAEMLFEAASDPDTPNVNGITARNLAKEMNHPLAKRL